MRLIVLSLAFFGLLLGATRADEAGLAALKAGGHVMIVRHGLTTPGFGDPRGFTLENCASQRNLVDEGREQAKRLGRLLREHKIEVERVLTSIWCRCQETAKLLEAGEVATHPALSNLVGRGEQLQPQTRSLRELIAAWQGKGTLVLVTHGSVIFPLAGVNPREAEGLVLKPAPGNKDGFVVAGRIGPTG